MPKAKEVARGKTKILYQHETQPDVLVVKQQDGITARDGEHALGLAEPVREDDRAAHHLIGMFRIDA